MGAFLNSMPADDAILASGLLGAFAMMAMVALVTAALAVLFAPGWEA